MKQTEIKPITPIYEKYALNVEEAAIYFNIGQKKLRDIIQQEKDNPTSFVLFVGNKVLIKRKNFERFLNLTSHI